MTEVRSTAKYVHISPRKARLVVDHIRGRSVPEARAVLAFTTRDAARDIEKVLASAVANAESRPDLQWHGDELVVASVTVDEGPTLKRWRARARGRVARIKKRSCHITVLLAPAAQEGLAGGAGRGRAAKSVTDVAGAAEPKPTAAKRAAKPKSETTSEPSATASARAKRGRKEAKS